MKDTLEKAQLRGYPLRWPERLWQNKYLGGKEIEKQKIICDSDISVLHVHINASSCFCY